MYTFNTNARNVHSKLNCFSMLSCLMFVLLITYAFFVDCQTRFDGETWINWGTIPTVIATTTTTTTAPTKQKRPAPPILHPSDEDYNQQFKSETIAKTSQSRTTTIRPRRTTNQPRTTFRPTARARTQAPTQPPTSAESLSSSWAQLEKKLEATPLGIQPCIWAVASCCKSQAEIQYTCFQYLGCIGDFWDVNSCSPEFYRDAVETVNNYFKS